MELGGSYLEVKIPSPIGSIGGFVARGLSDLTHPSVHAGLQQVTDKTTNNKYSIGTASLQLEILMEQKTYLDSQKSLSLQTCLKVPNLAFLCNTGEPPSIYFVV